MAAVDQIQDAGEDADADEHNGRPVKRVGVEAAGLGPEAKEDGEGAVGEGGAVDGHAVAAQAPIAGRQRVRVRDAAPQHDADADNVRRGQRDDSQRQQRVKGRRATEDDEIKRDGDDHGYPHGVGGDLEPRVHLSVVSTRRIATGRLRLTLPIHLENGRPLSRAKANVWRAVEALEEMLLRMTMNSRMPVSAPTALLETHCWKTYRNGKPVGSLMASWRSGMAKMYETMRMKPMTNICWRTCPRTWSAAP